jgi:hypothetical protein
MRRIIAQSVSMQEFTPQDTPMWDKAYQKFLDITTKA